jgi:hypothetical protein
MFHRSRAGVGICKTQELVSKPGYELAYYIADVCTRTVNVLDSVEIRNH